MLNGIWEMMITEQGHKRSHLSFNCVKKELKNSKNELKNIERPGMVGHAFSPAHGNQRQNDF